MVRKLIVVVCLATTFLAPVAPCVAQGVMPRVGAGGGGILARLNKPISPRISPVVALMGMRSATPQARRLYALTILSPRAAVVVGMLKAFSGMAGSLR